MYVLLGCVEFTIVQVVGRCGEWQLISDVSDNGDGIMLVTAEGADSGHNEDQLEE